MESVIFLTTLSAVLTTPYMNVIHSTKSMRIREHGNKSSRMKESQAWFTIKLDNKVYPVYRLVQPDESVVFIIEIEERKIKLFKLMMKLMFGADYASPSLVTDRSF